MSKLKIETYVDAAGEHQCRVLAPNGKILMVSSEGYTEKRSLDAMIKNVRTNIGRATICSAESTPKQSEPDGAE